MRSVIGILVFFFLMGCSSNRNESNDKPLMTKYAEDSHSFSKPNDVAITHLELNFTVDFDQKEIFGTAIYDLERTAGNTLRMDTRGLKILSVKDVLNNDLVYELNKGSELGDGLEITLEPETEKVQIEYKTSDHAAALLWMEPEQTLGKTAPFLFTQGQAILTRSWVPIQDSPSIRITYEANVKVPKNMLALMSAENPTEKNESGEYYFTMTQPIPPYLIALAVGDLTFKSIGPRSGVYAERAMIDEAAYEFADVEKMIDAAETLYGPYRWDRYDILVLPPSFPFGGMENPRLTFATPTILAGDRSLTSLVAHELAHSWSGNLVTNATWNDFWLNEGFTVYFEKRIMEALYGKDYADMLNELGRQDLDATIDELGAESDDTHLKLNLRDRDPDDGMTDIAYEKGYLFLRWLESLTGRDRFDKFLRNYFDEHAFQTMTTENFVEYLDSNLLKDIEPRPGVEAWIYKPGLPTEVPIAHSVLFEKVDSARRQYLNGDISVRAIPVSAWTTHEWLHFLRGLPANLGTDRMQELDNAFKLTETSNSEIAFAWFLLAIKNDYTTAFPALEAFLVKVGRRKFLKPLYEELAKTETHKIFAKKVYNIARVNYHTVSVQTIDKILDWS